MLYIITLICGLCNKVSSVLAGKLCTAVRLSIEIITEYSYVINIMNNKINLDQNPITVDTGSAFVAVISILRWKNASEGENETV